MQQETVTLIVAGLGIAGTLTSGPLTQYFARQAVHEQWERDKRTEEFRELLDALSVAYLEACERAENAVFMDAEDVGDNEELQTTDAEMTVYRLLRNRLFTAIELESEDVGKRWNTALIDFRTRGGMEQFAARFRSISATIVWLSTRKGDRPKHV
jgi:hypothetical protein